MHTCLHTVFCCHVHVKNNNKLILSSSRAILTDLIGWSQEQVRIKQAIEKTKQDEAVAIEKRKQEGAALLQDVMAGNAAMIERKKAEKIREIAEEQRIAAFVKDRDAKALVSRYNLSQVT